MTIQHIYILYNLHNYIGYTYILDISNDIIICK